MSLDGHVLHFVGHGSRVSLVIAILVAGAVLLGLVLKGATEEAGEGARHPEAHRGLPDAAGRVAAYGEREDGGGEQTHQGVCEQAAEVAAGQDGQDQSTRRSDTEPQRYG